MSERSGTSPGIYPATVEDNSLGNGMLKVKISNQQGNVLTAFPCTPFAGPGKGMLFIPPVNANVWVMFSMGESNTPIWMGGYWTNPKHVPTAAGEKAGPDSHVINTGDAEVLFSKEKGVILKVGETNATFAKDKITILTGGGKVEITNDQIDIEAGGKMTITSSSTSLSGSSSVELKGDSEISMTASDIKASGKVEITGEFDAGPGKLTAK